MHGVAEGVPWVVGEVLSSIVNLLMGTADNRKFCVVTYFFLFVRVIKNNQSSFKQKLAATTSQEVKRTVSLGITI